MSERDPRVDPRPDDILTKASGARVIVMAWAGGVKYRALGAVDETWTTLDEWRKWAKNAEVIHAAE